MSTDCNRLQRELSRLHNGDVDVSDLAINQRVSKRADEYTHYTRTVSALDQVDQSGQLIHPGEAVSYVVVDDSKRSRDRVRLEHEAEAGEYDPQFYADLLIRATESVISALGRRKDNIWSCIKDQTEVPLNAFNDWSK